ncbi:conjugal transfer protein TraO [Massilia sp. Root351]|jgi:cell filamentation protein|uniref:KfrB domain-containing protein n=1 Tax=Massilia sp. Root351 TaxID=1736522 RepID=UPI0007110ABA|nr:KfrB domain-containing protein [Massilia sp. Root351]KQV79932.1 conjugal transfer protein TraO [Massilia sp. Root351]
MKQRVVVMNGQRLVQSEYDNEWVTTKVGKAGQIQPGIYNISAAAVANKGKTYDGVILHTDQQHVYQQVGKTCVRHATPDFSTAPTIGVHAAIRYDADQAQTSLAPAAHHRGIKR